MGSRRDGGNLSVGPLTPMTTIYVPAGGARLAGELTVPQHATGLVLFAHGSGSSRFSTRNHFVARVLEQQGLATLLIDLLTPEEEALDQRTGHLRFDIPMLATRLVAMIDWLKRQPDYDAPRPAQNEIERRRTHTLPIGIFGASTGGGAALRAAAERPDEVAAVVSRGGRPDLAAGVLPDVIAPALLIVGGEDGRVIRMNQEAMPRMRGEVALEIIPGATHLFEEPGALQRVAKLAAGWFIRHLRSGSSSVADSSRHHRA
jgi:putative phosphoribosyl transferase